MMCLHMEAGSYVLRHLKTELMSEFANRSHSVAIDSQILQQKVQAHHNFVIVDPMGILSRSSVLVMLHCHEREHKL